MLNLKIGVFGSAAGEIKEETKAKAREVGREIARKGHILVTGACPGLPYEAVLGSQEEGGRVTGFSPALDIEEHVDKYEFPSEGFDELRFIPAGYPYKDSEVTCKKLRNVYSVSESDAGIFIAGRWGTLNEMTLAHDLGKDMGILLWTGGAAKFVRALDLEFKKDCGSRIFYHGDPAKLVELLTE